MLNGDILILKGHEVLSLLRGQENQIIETVRMAYETHSAGESSLPHSTFLRFPDSERDRIIALPAYLGQDFKIAGVKWISSFPGNLDLGLDRASAVVILNSATTGRPEAIIEGSIISAKRTAASAALAAKVLHGEKDSKTAGIIGCGLINLEIARFLQAARPDVKSFVVFDLDPARAGQFKDRCSNDFAGVEVSTATDVKDVFRNASLVSIATTAVKPHIDDLSDCPPGSTILHISLRDLMPEVILSSDNVVDDVDHVCRAETSVHLAEKLTGSRGFIRCTLADVLRGRASARKDDDGITVFSPFGLGVLDLAVAGTVRDLALESNVGTVMSSFLPESLSERAGQA